MEVLTSIDLRGNAVSRMAKYFERAVTRWELKILCRFFCDYAKSDIFVAA